MTRWQPEVELKGTKASEANVKTGPETITLFFFSIIRSHVMFVPGCLKISGKDNGCGASRAIPNVTKTFGAFPPGYQVLIRDFDEAF